MTSRLCRGFPGGLLLQGAVSDIRVGAGERGDLGRTWFGDADADIAALELAAVQLERLLQPVERGVLDVAEALGLAVELVLDDSHVCDGAVAKELFNIERGNIEGQVPEMCSVGWSCRQGKLVSRIAACTNRVLAS